MSGISIIAIVILVALVIMALVGIMVWIIVKKRTYIYTVQVWKDIGNKPTRAGVFKARTISIGRAGDQLMFVNKIKKYLPMPTIQSAPNEYWFWIREDGEWINFGVGDLDEDAQRTGVKYIHQDMRMQRLATDRLLEQRLMKKTFWEKWGNVIGMALLYIIIAVALTIFLFQYGKIVTVTGQLMERANSILLEAQGKGESGQLVPVEMILGIPTMLFRRRKKNDRPK